MQASVGMLGGAAPRTATPAPPSPAAVAQAPITSATVLLYNDGAPLSPAEQTVRLARLTAAASDPGDHYLKGGAVAELEARGAELFDKPAAAFFPTGTMANNVAVRLLCGDNRLVLVQRDSHLYADESDAPAILSGLNLVPLAPDRVSPSPGEIEAEVSRWEDGFFPDRVGAISLESPVRAHDGAFIPQADLEAVSAMARARRIGMHWDGARSLLLYGTPGFSPASTAALFDTIMLSLDKYLDAPTGALLIGQTALIDRARTMRHVFGGLLDRGWQLAMPPLAALPTFEAKYLEAQRRARIILDGLSGTDGFEVRPVPNGTNITLVRISASRLAGLQERLAREDIRARIDEQGLMSFYANPSLLRRSPETVLSALVG